MNKLYHSFFAVLFFVSIFLGTVSAIEDTALKMVSLITQSENSIDDRPSYAFLTYTNPNEITLINLDTGLTAKPIVLDNIPKEVVVTPDLKTAFVSYEDSIDITPFDLVAGEIGSPINLGKSPDCMAITSDSKMLYCTISDSNEVIPYDLFSKSIGTPISVKKSPRKISIRHDNKVAYVTHEGLSEIIPINLSTGKADQPIIRTSILEEEEVISQEVFFTNDPKKAYVINSNSLIPIDLVDQSRDEAIPLNKLPHNMAITSDGEIAYVIQKDSNEITSIDLIKGVTGKSIYCHGVPIGLFLLNDAKKKPGSEPTTIILTSDPKPSVLGMDVQLKASVFYGDHKPVTTGMVQFKVNEVPFESSVALNDQGQALLTIHTLPKGTSHITAEYLGEGIFARAASDLLLQEVQNFHTKTILDSSSPTAVYSENVTFTATVFPIEPTSEKPTGKVKFFVETDEIGVSTLDANNQAFFSTSTLRVGSYFIFAFYEGDDNFDYSLSSNLFTQVVTRDPTYLVQSSSSLNDTSVFGQSVTFTAEVIACAPGVGIPTGKVKFLDREQEIGFGILDEKGVTTFSTSSLSVGSHPIFAVYVGDDNYTFSVASNLLTQIIVPDQTATTITSLPNPSNLDQLVTFVATVSPHSPSSGTPTGQVKFFSDSQLIACGNLSNGQFSFTTSSLTPGSHSISAVYQGSTNFDGSTSNLVIQIVDQETSISVISSVNPSVFGQEVTFTAQITPNNSIVQPTGTVEFYDGTTLIGCGQVNASAQATFSTSSLNVDDHSITAVYQGDENFNSSTSAPCLQTVSQALTTTALTSSLNPSNYGELITFTATVVPVSPGSGTPTGIVNFYLGLREVGSATLDANGQAILTMDSLTIGTHIITAIYLGDNNFTTSLFPQIRSTVQEQSITSLPIIIQSVLAAPTTIECTSSHSPSNYGEAVTLTAQVTPPGSGTPTGIVKFYDGAAFIGSGVVNSGGQASLSISTLSVGNHSITAVYQGDGSFLSSTSPILLQTVDKALTTTVVTTSLNPSIYGEMITFTATVTPVNPGAGNPTGIVSFYVETTEIGSANLNGNSQGIFSIDTLTIGTHVVTAVYQGDNNFTRSLFPPAEKISTNRTSTSGKAEKHSLPLIQQTVLSAATSTQCTSSHNPANEGESITFTAHVARNTQGSTMPTGEIVFFDGESVIGSSNLNNHSQATFTTSSLNAGSHFIKAVYQGNADFISSSSEPFQQDINSIAPRIPPTPPTPPSPPKPPSPPTPPSLQPLPPTQLKGKQIKDKYATKGDLINKITWKAPKNGPKVVEYRIYRNSELTDLAGVTKATKKPFFKDHNRRKQKAVYYVVSIDSLGNQSPPTKVVVAEKSGKGKKR